MDFIPQDSMLLALRKVDTLLGALAQFLNQNEIRVKEKNVEAIVKVLEISYNIPELKRVIKEFVEKHGGKYDGTDAMTAVMSLATTKAIENNVPYMGVIVENGYVKDIVPVNDFMKTIEVPEDLKRGYYKYENGKLIVDEARKALLWGD